jgi:hypothetical protein
LGSEASSQIAPSASSRDLEIYPKAVKLIGFKVYHIPQNVSVYSLAEISENPHFTDSFMLCALIIGQTLNILNQSNLFY